MTLRRKLTIELKSAFAELSFKEVIYSFLSAKVAVKCRAPKLIDHFNAMFGSFQVTENGKVDATFYVLAEDWQIERQIGIRSGQILIDTDGELRIWPYGYGPLLPPFQILPPKDKYIFLHAGAAGYNGVGFIFPGKSGSGKTTLTVALAKAGFDFLSDEFAIINRETKILVPFCRGMTMSAETLALFNLKKESMMHNFEAKGSYMVPVEKVCPPSANEATPGFIVFPTYIQGVEPNIKKMRKSQAVTEILNTCFFGYSSFEQALDEITDLTNSAECYQLTTGNLDKTASLVKSLVK